MRALKTTFVTALAICTMAGAAHSQDQARREPVGSSLLGFPIQVGDTLTGELNAADALTQAGNRADTYRILLRGGTVIRVTAEPSGFPNTLLSIAPERQSLYPFSARAARREAASLIYEPQSTGYYLVRIVGDYGGMGAYSIAIEEITDVPRSSGGDIVLGDSVSGVLESDGPRTIGRSLFRDYVLRAAPNARISLELNAGDGSPLDPYLEVGNYRENGTLLRRYFDDDGGGDLNSRLVLTAPGADADPYVVRARAFGLSAGEYVLRATELPASGPTPEPVRLRLGRPVSGALAMTDAMIPEDGRPGFRPYRLYEVRGAAGDVFTVEMTSDDFATNLEVGALTPVGYVTLTEDPSRLALRFEREGVLVIRASAAVRGGTGLFVIALSRGGAPQPN